MVLLDIMSKCLTAEELIVAHFNHGTRGRASDEDEQLVQTRAVELGINFIAGRAELGEGASEALARKARYDFLLNTACQAGAELWTAQHFDDVIESVAINLMRGTGWRGLAAMGRAEVVRPFIEAERLPERAWQLLEIAGYTQIITRQTLVRYAAKEGVHFREDASNHDNSYLRGRIREKLTSLNDKQKLVLADLFRRQKLVRSEIELVIDGMIDRKTLAERKWTEIDPIVAIELIKSLGRKNGLRLTQAEAERLLIALNTLPKGKKVNLSNGKLVEMQKGGLCLTF